MAARRLRLYYAGVEVRDLERSLAFYRGLGFRVERRGTMEHGGQWVHLRRPRQGNRLELNYYPKGTPFHRPYRAGSELDHLGLVADDADAWARRAVALGGRRVARIQERNEKGKVMGILVYVTDPDGIWLEFIGPTPRRRRRRS